LQKREIEYIFENRIEQMYDYQKEVKQMSQKSHGVRGAQSIEAPSSGARSSGALSSGALSVGAPSAGAQVVVDTLSSTRAADAPVYASIAPKVTGKSSRSIRLTRRGRIVFGALGASVLTAVLLAGGFSVTNSAVASQSQSQTEFGYVLPAYGDSLWSIAEQLDPSADPRDLVYEIHQLNNLSGSDVDVNEPVAVPLRYADEPGVVSAEQAGVDTE
jgi:hypothetical protein